jgi:hypothetical protein
MTEERPPRVDLAQFESVDDAIEKVAAAGDYNEVAKHFLSQEGIDPIALPVLFFSSMVNRCNSLHAAIAREMRAENPHAVFPLIRAYSEGSALLIYVYDHVGYIPALIDDSKERQRGTPARLKVGKLVAYAVKHAPGFKHAYDELTDFTHFGSTAMWSPFVLSDGDGDSLSFTWTSYPRWRNDEQALIAAALTLEVSDATHALLGNFGNRYLSSGESD